jgi:hypothetical protein
VTAAEDPQEAWLAIVADADLAPRGNHAKAVTDTIRRVVGATPSEPLAERVVRDQRRAAELSAAYLQEWRRRRPAQAEA